jgi:uncharacterized protein YjiS (DUF1127 family)
MPAITILSISAAAAIARRLGALGRALAGGAMRIGRTIMHRRAAAALAKLDDRMLADIGLSRADLRDAYAESIWNDPTMLLRARAHERRSARRGISYGFAPETATAPPLVPKVAGGADSQAGATLCGCG